MSPLFSYLTFHYLVYQYLTASFDLHILAMQQSISLFSDPFSHSVNCLCSVVNVSFAIEKLFSLMYSHLSILSLNCWAIVVLFRKLLPLCSSVFHIFSCSSFRISFLTLRSLIHFELIYVQGERQGSSFGLLCADILFPQHHLLKKLSFLQCMFWAPLSKLRWLWP
jgi:hypothetical protein